MNNSYELLLDTCNDFCYLALINKKQKIEEIKLKVNKNITDLINKAITNLVKKAKIKFSHITDIYVNIGPGSFTGEKVGIIICKAWKLIYPKIKIHVINSLLLQVKKLPAISVIDAKSNKLYIAVFGLNKTIIEPKIIEKNKLEKFLKKYKNFNFYCDQTNFFYSSFSQHKKDFKLTNKLEPLYLKNPI